jgi:uncharacterized membrane protein YdjX (TVP38/TMEM64 family)
VKHLRAVRAALIGIWLVVVSTALYLYFFHRAAVEGELQDALSVTSIAAALIYLALGSIRAFTLIPATFLILAGLPFFSPGVLFVLTLAGIAISSSSIYWFSDALRLDEMFERSHARQVDRMKRILNRNELPIIVGWAFFPFTPTDLICYVCGALRVNFKIFLLGILIGEGTICAIYIFLGTYLFNRLPFTL